MKTTAINIARIMNKEKDKEKDNNKEKEKDRTVVAIQGSSSSVSCCSNCTTTTTAAAGGTGTTAPVQREALSNITNNKKVDGGKKTKSSKKSNCSKKPSAGSSDSMLVDTTTTTTTTTTGSATGTVTVGAGGVTVASVVVVVTTATANAKLVKGCSTSLSACGTIEESSVSSGGGGSGGGGGGGGGEGEGEATSTTTSTTTVTTTPNTTAMRSKSLSDIFMIEESKEIEQPVWDDIDVQDADDPQAVSEYVNEIYKFLMEKEKDLVDPDYMSNQSDINEKMRAILVDWLVEVHRMFKLLPESLFLCVGVIDRYLSLTPHVPRDKLQLVGITSMLIASKYEEIYSPECNDFVYISDGAYTKQHILKMEQHILNTLQFEHLTHPSPLHFLRRYSKAAGSDYTLHTLCKYLIELTLVDLKFLLRHPPSLVAAASVYVARAMTMTTASSTFSLTTSAPSTSYSARQRPPLWTPTLEHYTTYTEETVRSCAKELNSLLKRSQTSSLKAIKKKYSLPKFGEVAEIPLVDL